MKQNLHWIMTILNLIVLCIIAHRLFRRRENYTSARTAQTTTHNQTNGLSHLSTKHIIITDSEGNLDTLNVENIMNEILKSKGELDDRIDGLDSRMLKKDDPEAVWQTISKVRNKGFPVFPIIGDQHRPKSSRFPKGEDFKCIEGESKKACPNGYTCALRGNIGRCYKLKWNRNH